VIWLHSALDAREADTAADVVRQSGVQGGLIVHVGCADAELGPAQPPVKQPGNWWRTLPGSRVRTIWSRTVPFYVRAITLSGDTLFVAGPSETADFASKAPSGDVWLWAVSVAEGRKQAEHPLAASPVFDSLAACDTGLYFSTVNGQILCFRPQE
jgi:hypothetical protein